MLQYEIDVPLYQLIRQIGRKGLLQVIKPVVMLLIPLKTFKKDQI
jgi:hypothetical protein